MVNKLTSIFYSYARSRWTAVRQLPTIGIPLTFLLVIAGLLFFAMYCLSFFDLLLLVTYLISSNFSWSICMAKRCDNNAFKYNL